MGKLIRLLAPYRLYVVLVMIFIFLQSIANLYLPTLMEKMVDNGVYSGHVRYILHVGGFMLLVSIAGVIFSILASLIAARTSANFGRLLRLRVFSHVENFTLHEFDKLGTASLITRTTNDITQVQQLVNMMLRLMVMAPLMCIGGILMAVYTDARLSLILVVVVPLLAAVILSVFSKSTRLFRSIQAKIDTLNRVLRENLTGIRVIRSFHKIRYEKIRFEAANEDLTGTSIRVNKLMAIMTPALTLIINAATIAIIWFGGERISHGQMEIGSLMAFIQYVLQIMMSLMMVTMVFFMVPRASACAVRINEVLEMDPEMPEVQTGIEKIKHGVVEFRNASFYYPGAENPAIANISFTAKPGETTAIIGGTGAGKSTLVQLIPRFYDVAEGSIIIDGVDVREMKQAYLRSFIGYVPQKAVLFSGSISENIQYGKENATENEVKYAAEVAQASEFIRDMNQGFDTFIEQGGINVSGGQKQRLSIARALARKPLIYIFDDSFSALDFRTDANLRAALKSETADSTVLIVAQRVSTILDADQIIVLSEGTIVGTGRHEELMETCEIYREIVNSQMSEEEIA